MEDVLRSTEEEFNQFPIFVRPMARGGFKRKAGQSVQDWRRTLARFTDLTDRAHDDDEQTLAQMEAECGLMASRLDQLISYFEAVPGETARFTKDPELLCGVTQIMGERVAAAQRLRLALAR